MEEVSIWPAGRGGSIMDLGLLMYLAGLSALIAMAAAGLFDSGGNDDDDFPKGGLAA